jgi:Amt family ammonium transporter
MFAATGATIVSGAVAERVKLGSFMIFAVLFVGLHTQLLVHGTGAEGS